MKMPISSMSLYTTPLDLNSSTLPDSNQMKKLA